MNTLKKLIICSAIALSGCASFSGAPKAILDTTQEIEILKPSFDSTQVLSYFSADPGSKNRTNLRNKIISSRLYATDLRFSEYAQTIAKELRGGAFGMDLASLVLTGAATIIDPSSTTRVLAGIDTALKGGRQSFNKKVLIDKTLNVLLTQMKADRKRIATQIWYSLSNHSDKQYPLPLALSQLEEYYQAGTLSSALISVGESASQQSTKASKAFDEMVIQISFGENNYTKLLNEYINAAPNSTEETRRLRLIQDEIKKAGETILAPFLINSNDSKYQPLQKKIAETLKLGSN